MPLLPPLLCHSTIFCIKCGSLRYNPARAIPMKWGAVYMGVFMAFWGLCKIILTCPSPDVSPSSIVHIAFRLYSQPIPGKAAYDIGLWREVEVSNGVIFTEWKRTKSKWSCKDQINISGTEKHSLYQLPMALGLNINQPLSSSTEPDFLVFFLTPFPSKENERHRIVKTRLYIFNQVHL